MKEDTKLQNTTYDVMYASVSSNGSLNCAPTQSPHSNLSIVPTSKNPITSQKLQKPHSKILKIPWNGLNHHQKPTKETILPMRRRFHSSDILLETNTSEYVIKPNDKVLKPVTRHPHGLNETCCFLGEEKVDPEPLAEPDQFLLRRRTCSENITKSRRILSTPLSRNDSFYDIKSETLEYKKRWKRNQIDQEEERQSNGNELEQLIVVKCHKELKQESFADDTAAGRPVNTLLETLWSSQSSVVGRETRRDSNDERRFVSGSYSSVESEGQNLEKLRNLQKLFQEGFLTVTEYKDRRAQLVDELSEADQTIAKTSDLLLLDLPIIYRAPPDFSLLRERDAIKHVFDSEYRTWASSRIKVKIDAKPFASGGLRQVFHLQDLSMPHHAKKVSDGYDDSVMSKCSSHVAKIAIDPNENPDTYFKDVEMQAVAAKYAKLYNSYNPPRRVEFLEACILQLIPTDASGTGDQAIENLTLRGTICGVEPFIAGEYHKHNNNFGYVSELERNTPQAFSHFTYEASGQQIIVVDIQGVGDHYTDPQIHSRRGKEFGKGNLALRGFARFLGSHRCNPICQYLKLPMVNPKDEEKRQVDPKGTIPAQTYMSQPRVAIDQVDSVLCHYYGNSKAYKRYAAKTKRGRKKRGIRQQKNSYSRPSQDAKRQAFGMKPADDAGEGESIKHDGGAQETGNKFAAALVDQHRSCSSFVCDGVLHCIVS